MRKLTVRLFTAMAAIALIASLGVVAAENEVAEGQAQAQIKIEGMTCGGCCMKVETALAELDGVVSAKADYKAGTASVVYVSGEVTVDKIVATINEKTSFKASVPETAS